MQFLVFKLFIIKKGKSLFKILFVQINYRLPKAEAIHHIFKIAGNNISKCPAFFLIKIYCFMFYSNLINHYKKPATYFEIKNIIFSMFIVRLALHVPANADKLFYVHKITFY